MRLQLFVAFGLVLCFHSHVLSNPIAEDDQAEEIPCKIYEVLSPEQFDSFYKRVSDVGVIKERMLQNVRDWSSGQGPRVKNCVVGAVQRAVEQFNVTITRMPTGMLSSSANKGLVNIKRLYEDNGKNKLTIAVEAENIRKILNALPKSARAEIEKLLEKTCILNWDISCLFGN